MVTAFKGSRFDQRGAVLVVSLLLLLVMTILALSMSQTTRMQERMAGNYRDSELAFQVAEAGIRASEKDLKSLTVRPITCDDPKACRIVELGTFEAKNIDLSRQDNTWWKDNGQEYGTSSPHDLPNVHEDPKYVVEYYADVKIGGLGIGNGPEQRRIYYKTTARGHGATEDSTAIVESVFAGVPP